MGRRSRAFSEEIQIHTPSSTIQCQLYRTSMDVLYNPMVSANLMSTSFAHTYFGDDILAPINKYCRITPKTRLEGSRVLQNISLYHNKNEISLDFHVFDIQDFDIMIGHPIEKLFVEPPKSGDLDVKIGRDTFSIPITRAKNSVAESLSYPKLLKEVMSVSPFESPESSLEKDAKLFTEEEDNLDETIELPKEEAPT
jgi:hypothetical protein